MAAGATPMDRARPSEAMAEWVLPLIVEGIGTFTLIFVGAGAIIQTAGTNLVAIALAHGLAIGLMVAAAGHISGGAYNPAVTLGLAIAGKLRPDKAVAYVVAQLIGAVVAALMLKAVFPSELVDAVALGTPAVGAGFSAGNALLAELITTFFFLYIIFGVAVDRRGPVLIAPLVIGLAIAMDIFAIGGVSGAAMNPARWFGPALVQGEWSDWWVWIVGPLVGGALAAALYYYVYMQGHEVSPRQTPEPDRL